MLYRAEHSARRGRSSAGRVDRSLALTPEAKPAHGSACGYAEGVGVWEGNGCRRGRGQQARAACCASLLWATAGAYTVGYSSHLAGCEGQSRTKGSVLRAITHCSPVEECVLPYLRARVEQGSAHMSSRGGSSYVRANRGQPDEQKGGAHLANPHP